MKASGVLTCKHCGAETAWPMRCDCKPLSNDKRGKLTDAQKRMHDAVASIQQYVATYDKQYGYLDYSDATFINDILYGIGRALDKKYEFANGFEDFKTVLREGLSVPSATREPADVEKLNAVLRQAGWSQGEIDSAAETVWKLERDAERYRFIRAPENARGSGDDSPICKMWAVVIDVNSTSEQMDAAIDDARSRYVICQVAPHK